MHLTFAEQQRANKRSKTDGLYMFALCALVFAALCIVFAQLIDVLDARDQRALQALSDARLKYSGSRMCLRDGRTLDQVPDDEPVRQMRGSWCKR